MKLHLSQELVEEGREHPFTEALLKELATRRDECLQKLQDGLAGGGKAPLLRAIAGRAAAYKDVMGLINKVEGNDNE